MTASSLDEERDNDSFVTSVHVTHSLDNDIEAKPKAVVLIESRPLVRLCLSRWLKEDFGIERFLTFSEPGDLALPVKCDLAVDLIIWSLGGLALSKVDSHWGLESVKATFPSVPIVLLADREDVADVAEAMQRGARGYIPTSLDQSEIKGILRFVRSGGTFVPPSIILDRRSPFQEEPPSIDTTSPFDDLTPREREVVDLLRHAKSNKIIAYDLNLSESTVKVIVHRILNKLNAANRTEVACLAQRYFEQRPPSPA